MRDKKGFFWLGTNKGLTKINFEKGKFQIKKFDTKDGLPSNEFNSTAIWQTRDGHIYSGTNTGFTAFHPDSILDNPYPQSFDDQTRQFKTLAMFDGRACLKNINAETLVIYGTQDLISLPMESEYMASHIPQSTLLPFDCGHGITHELPNALAVALKRFLD